MDKNYYDMIYLAACALNSVQPEQEKVMTMNPDMLYRICQFHNVTAITAAALKSAGIVSGKFTEAAVKAIRNNLLMDAERFKVCRFMENNRIRHMPLKGVVLKEMYPQVYFRQMADIDIFYDIKYQDMIQEFMLKNGYSVKSIGKSHHDTYTKPPIYNFELHTSLFDETSNEKISRYYFNIKNKLIKDTDKKFSYHFSDEDFYIYMTAHEYKHYINAGTGIRSLMDRFVYIKSKGLDLNWNYIQSELEKQGIAEFERISKTLCLKVFSNPGHSELSETEQEMLTYYLHSGTYGTCRNYAENRIKKFQRQTGSNSPLKYLLYRIFPPMEFYKLQFPMFYQCKILLPIVWLYRFTKALIFCRKHIKNELQTLHCLKNTQRYSLK